MLRTSHGFWLNKAQNGEHPNFYGSTIADVKLAPDAIVYTDKDCVKADTMHLSNFRPWENDLSFAHSVIEHDARDLRHFSNPAEEICDAAVARVPHTLMYVKSQTRAQCMSAVWRDPNMKRYVHDCESLPLFWWLDCFCCDTVFCTGVCCCCPRCRCCCM